MNCVNWYEAYAFCIWDVGFLPRETEWEYAAVGGNQQRQYPWGTADPGTANQYAIFNCNYPNLANNEQGCAGATNIAPVGTATMEGHLRGHLVAVPRASGNGLRRPART
jgi:formylglycine-generating enzyme required for sulfatase activity